MFRHPSRNALPHAQFQAIDRVGMRSFGCPQDEVIVFEHIDQAGVALHQRSSKFDDTTQNFVKSVRRIQPNADFMEYINV